MTPLINLWDVSHRTHSSKCLCSSPWWETQGTELLQHDPGTLFLFATKEAALSHPTVTGEWPEWNTEHSPFLEGQRWPTKLNASIFNQESTSSISLELELDHYWNWSQYSTLPQTISNITMNKKIYIFLKLCLYLILHLKFSEKVCTTNIDVRPDLCVYVCVCVHIYKMSSTDWDLLVGFHFAWLNMTQALLHPSYKNDDMIVIGICSHQVSVCTQSIMTLHPNVGQVTECCYENTSRGER